AHELADAPARGTRGLDPEETLRLHDLPATGAIAATLGRRTGLGARAVASRTKLRPLDFDRAHGAESRLAQVELDRAAEAVATGGASSAATSRIAAEEALEKIAERAEDIVDVVEARLPAARTGERLVPVTVVEGP